MCFSFPVPILYKGEVFTNLNNDSFISRNLIDSREMILVQYIYKIYNQKRKRKKKIEFEIQ